MDRRSFLGLGLGAAAAVALPGEARADEASGGTVAALDGAISGKDSPLFSKVKFTPLTVAVGAKKPFKVVHCSDSHMAFMTVNDLVGGMKRDLEMYDYRLKEMANGIPSLAACVLKARREKLPLFHTGDLYDYESEAAHFMAADAFGGLDDYVYAPGNHEYHGHWGGGISGAAVTTSRQRLEKDVKMSVSVSSLVLNGVNFVAFDNGGLSFGLEAKQLSAIKREFEKGLPVVLLCHLPLYTKDLYEYFTKSTGPRAGEKPIKAETMPWILCGMHAAEKPLLAYLAKQPLLKAVLCGHLHREYQFAFTDKVTQYVAGATYKGNAYEITFC